MAVRNDNFGGDDWSDGDVLNAEDLNDTFDSAALSSTIHKNYDGSDLDVNAAKQDDETVTDTGTTTISIDAGDYDYIKIDFLGKFSAYASAGSSNADINSTASLKIDVDGGDNILDKQIVDAQAEQEDDKDNNTQFSNIVLYYEPTQTEKDEGFDLVFETEAKVSSNGSYGSGSASFNLTGINIFRSK